MSISIDLKKANKVFRKGEVVSGVVVVVSKGSMAHNGINLLIQGVVTLQLSAKSVGLFEAFYNSLKPITLVQLNIEIAKSGKLPQGRTEFQFEFELQPLPGQEVYETYHGVFVNIQYNMVCDCARSLLAKNLSFETEFIVEGCTQLDTIPTSSEINFVITPQSLRNVKQKSLSKIPNFKITGKLNTATCKITEPLQGEIIVCESEALIRSIELQLVRVETCGCADGFAKEATEIQNIQIADGDICHGLPLPIYMIFPRLFTCPTIAARTFKIEFEVNLVVMLADGHLITENLPIRLLRY
eukprot:CAMPEP_0174267062 /NCGR_PEP_ID=MMETSP0439-20130205/32321_1 /TAXON_ID=0 /ORGANISM="Stereomyxa ramosa, Strain Chinc5" /LENGTH=298 /DNA_ID=CAMNT_0015354365 /DNA_START=60 /DNA_END=953 /DNA_ORIENTATION=+